MVDYYIFITVLLITVFYYYYSIFISRFTVLIITIIIIVVIMLLIESDVKIQSASRNIAVHVPRISSCFFSVILWRHCRGVWPPSTVFWTWSGSSRGRDKGGKYWH